MNSRLHLDSIAKKSCAAFKNVRKPIRVSSMVLNASGKTNSDEQNEVKRFKPIRFSAFLVNSKLVRGLIPRCMGEIVCIFCFTFVEFTTCTATYLRNF